MNERILIQVVGSVMVYDATARQWNPAGTSSGLSSVRLIHCLSNNTFRIHGQKINDAREVVLDNQITRGVKYNRTNDAFIQWHDSQAFWGLNFRRGTQDAENFFNSVVSIIETLNQGPAQQPQQPQQLQQQSQQQQQKLPNELAGNNQQQQLQQQSSAAVIQRSIQQHQLITQPPTQLQQPQQQQVPQQQQMLQHMLNQQHQQHQSQAMLGPAPPIQMMQQQSQQMMHQRQPQTQSLANQNQIQHYQHPHQAHMQQQHQQPPQIQQPQVAQVVSAPIPPPPPPPPPAAIAGALNNCRTNGTSSSSGSTNTESQRSSIITNSSNLVEANGGSPSQMSMLASELARCQLRKVSLARSDSDTPRDSESNNNNVGVPKTIRAASFASAESNLMNDLAKRLASTREQLEKGTENHSSNNHGSSNNLNGTGIDKSHESWLADLISKEISKGISKEMARFKVELLDVIKEFKQR